MGRGEGRTKAKGRLLGALTALTGVTVAFGGVGGCGSADTSFQRPATGGAASSGICQPGDTRACVGAGRCAGGQICNDQSRWGSCDCGNAPSSLDGGGATTGAGGTSGIGGASSGSGGASIFGFGGQKGLAGAPSSVQGTPIGRACRVDADCGASKVFCLSSASIALDGGGPPNGLCVADCTADTTTCARLDPTSMCVAATAGGRAFCFETCTVGAAGVGTKCHGRLDLACDDGSSAGPSAAFCRAMCRGNADCPGRRCDLGTGLCEDVGGGVGTLGIGAPCNPAAATDACAAICVPLDSTNTGGECDGFCTLGSVGCGEDLTSTAPLQSACLFDATTAGPGDVGDIGVCGALCDCDAQCVAAGRVCTPFTAAEEAGFGRAGYCASQAVAPSHITRCP